MTQWGTIENIVGSLQEHCWNIREHWKHCEKILGKLREHGKYQEHGKTFWENCKRNAGKIYKAYYNGVFWSQNVILGSLECYMWLLRM